ncbi:hypothetical protein [Delftia lacustris]|uniref:hypothetical protein n=1 Tax=Delftia lacustris TaxID=558537 RepID=UPI001EEF8FC0|nr:hypothetical protein [Delftia lacustris]
MAFHSMRADSSFRQTPVLPALAFGLVALLGTTAFAAGLQRQVLESLPSGTAKGAPAYELSLPACTASACPFELRLVRAGMEQGKPAALAWPASRGQAKLAPSDPLYGVGDPLSEAAQRARVWTTGEEEGTVTAAARTLRLPGVQGGARALLVTQMGGFDHPKRRHALYVATAQGPHLAWQYEEPPGSYQSWVLAPTGRIPVLLVRYDSPQDDAPDQIETRSLRWNAGRQAFAEQASAPPAAVQAVVAARYAGVAAARAARAAGRLPGRLCRGAHTPRRSCAASRPGAGGRGYGTGACRIPAAACLLGQAAAAHGAFGASAAEGGTGARPET